MAKVLAVEIYLSNDSAWNFQFFIYRQAWIAWSVSESASWSLHFSQNYGWKVCFATVKLRSWTACTAEWQHERRRDAQNNMSIVQSMMGPIPHHPLLDIFKMFPLQTTDSVQKKRQTNRLWWNAVKKQIWHIRTWVPSCMAITICGLWQWHWQIKQSQINTASRICTISNHKTKILRHSMRDELAQQL